MRKAILIALLAMVTAGFLGASIASAYATPAKTTPCTGCHSGAGAKVVASLVSNNGTSATYNVTASGATAIAVFNGTTKVTTIIAASGQFSVATGKTYTIYAVTGPKTSNGIGSATVSPVAPVIDVTAPTTVSNAQPSYASVATITLTPTDDAAGSGVAATYYALDGGAQLTGTQVLVSAPGAHSLAFWSGDTAGNVEAQKTATFTVGVATPTSVSLATSSSVVAYGARPVLRGALLTTVLLAGRQLVLQSSADNLTWKNTATMPTTDGTGAFTVTVRPAAKTYYRVRFAGDADCLPCASSSVVVNPRVYLSTPYAPTAVVHLKAFTSFGYLKPRFVAGTYPVKLLCYRYQAGKWVIRKSVMAKAANYSTYTKYSRSTSLPYAGRWRIRAYRVADAKHAATYSAYRYVVAK